MTSDRVTQPARVGKIDLRFHDPKGYVLSVSFCYGDSSQDMRHTIGRDLDNDFLSGFYTVCGKKYLRDCEGSVVLVTHDDHSVYRIDPMPWDKGSIAPLDVEEWAHVHPNETLIAELYTIHSLLEMATYVSGVREDPEWANAHLAKVQCIVESLLERYNGE